MDYCQEIMEKYSKDLFPQSLGIEIIYLSPGSCQVQMVVKDEMTNFHQITHGGALFTLADTAFGLASNSRGPAVALQVSVNFMTSSRGGQTLVATAREEHLTRSTGIYNVDVQDERGEAIMLFRGVVYRFKGKNNIF